RASSLPLRRFSRTGRIPRARRSRKRSRATSAAAPGTRRSWTPSSWPPCGSGFHDERRPAPLLRGQTRVRGHRSAPPEDRRLGDAVAAVAAVDEETAERACRLIDVEYEPLRALMSIEESLAHPEIRIHEYGDGPNVHKNVALQFGDVEAAFARADLVREDVFFYEGNTHLPMEQHAAVASAGPDGKLTL